MKTPSKLLMKRACALFAALACAFGAFARGGGGCFTYDTPIAMADGSSKPIGEVRAGDLLLAGALDGSVVKSRVEDVFSLEAESYLEVKVASAVLRVTPEHPFYVGNGAFRTAGSLRAGDTVYALDGRALRPESVESVRAVASRTTVYNLSAESPNTFFAGGILVHNKGGGCFLPDTPVLMADGSAKEIGAVRVGDRILTASPDGKPALSAVREIFSLDVSEYLEVNIDGIVLRVTEEHPFFVGDGKFKAVGSLQPGDFVYTFDGRALARRRIAGIKRVEAKAIVYNLSAESPNTFVAGSVLVHNKGGGGGCFLAGTPILMADGGSKDISEIKPGDRILTGTPEGKPVTAGITNVFSLAAEEYLDVSVEGAVLRVTAEHPFYVGNGEFRKIGSLSVGDYVYAFDGKALAKKRITGMKTVAGPVRVYNLSADSPNTFVAGGVLVHNKGGGFAGGYHGGYRSGSSGSTSTSWADVIAAVIVIGFIGVFIFYDVLDENGGKRHEAKSSGSLDKIFGESAIARRVVAAEDTLASIAAEDPSFDEAKLKKVAELAFTTLQKAWEGRDYRTMEPLATKSLRARHEAQLAGLKRDHEINRIDGLKINRIEIVHVCYAPARSVREFSAIIDARAVDYYIDDRSHLFVRGDLSPTRFQEIYIFRKAFGGPWLLAGIEQTKETKRMRARNVYEPGGAAAPAAAGPETAVLSSPPASRTRMERELDRLARHDPSWNPDTMAERAASIFTQVYMHREGGPALPAGSCSPEIAGILAAEDAARASGKVTLEYRNFCVRACHVSSYRNGDAPEFTARISAHAQRRFVRDGSTVLLDDDVHDFTEYWTFARSDNDWRLAKLGSGKSANAG